MAALSDGCKTQLQSVGSLIELAQIRVSYTGDVMV